jgi:hypothetical protein
MEKLRVSGESATTGKGISKVLTNDSEQNLVSSQVRNPHL